MTRRWIWAVWMLLQAGMACAGGITFGESRAAPLFGEREAAPFIQTSLTGTDAQGAVGSLFAGQAKGGMFAPLERRLARANIPANGPIEAGVRGLKALIARAEAGPDGYDAVVWSARIKPPKPPTAMTLGEIMVWIDATPGQNHAIGRYQFIPKTLRWLISRAGLPRTTQFTPDVQDRLAYLLLTDAGLEEFLAGDLSQEAFMNNLARIWAGLPTSSGRSHYHGLAGNRATMSWESFDAQMRVIFPQG